MNIAISTEIGIIQNVAFKLDGKIEALRERLESSQEKFMNMPKRSQQSDKGIDLQDKNEQLEFLIYRIEKHIDSLNSIAHDLDMLKNN